MYIIFNFSLLHVTSSQGVKIYINEAGPFLKGFPQWRDRALKGNFMHAKNGGLLYSSKVPLISLFFVYLPVIQEKGKQTKLPGVKQNQSVESKGGTGGPCKFQRKIIYKI